MRNSLEEGEIVMRWSKYSELNAIIDSIEEAEGFLESCSPEVKDQLLTDVKAAVRSVNRELFSYNAIEIDNNLIQWIYNH